MLKHHEDSSGRCVRYVRVGCSSFPHNESFWLGERTEELGHHSDWMLTQAQCQFWSLCGENHLLPSSCSSASVSSLDLHLDTLADSTWVLLKPTPVNSLNVCVPADGSALPVKEGDDGRFGADSDSIITL